MARVILHADLNNFYASVACLKEPIWQEEPLAVCGDPSVRHGIVLAKNMPAKKLGIQTGQVIWQAKQLCPDLITVAPDVEQILAFSKQVRGIFSRYTSHVQPFGADEAWLDLSEPSMTIQKGYCIANHIRHTIREETGLTVSIGVSDNRIFAKLGSDLKKPDAVTVICQENRKTVLDPLPVGELLFVGKATTAKLHQIGIYNIGQLARVDVQVLKGILGKPGVTLSRFANGDDVSPILPTAATPTVKSVGNSLTTAKDLTTYEEAKITLFGLCDSVASRLRKKTLWGSSIQISMRDHTLATTQRQCTVPCTNSSYDLFHEAYGLLRHHWNQKNPLRSLGVSVTNLSYADGEMQMSLLPKDALRQKHAMVEQTMDQLRARFGHASIGRALMLSDLALGDINPEHEHVLHPESYFKACHH